MGFAAPADDELADTVTIGRYLLRDKDASYLLQMSGDRFAADGILHGDMIIFERSRDFRVGDIVVALGDDGYSLEYFTKGMRGQIIGVVTGSFRKYK
ncbi:MAG TPA: S24 family peptidase [Candidatus Paceibacterota bacterium]|nr:S24 family peptidase [Candidatus Paceibacterota bacterium]